MRSRKVLKVLTTQARLSRSTPHEIEVTSAMIRAGEDAMQRTRDPADGDVSVFAIFAAMIAASAQFRCSSVLETER